MSRHHIKMKRYRAYLRDLLLPLVQHTTGSNTPSNFLLRSIRNFTDRVAGAHSWYKHLSMAEDRSFVFSLDPTVNMHYDRRSAKFYDKVRGDGSEFHYTWTPSKDYRERFFFFDYSFCGTMDNANVSDFEGESYFVPQSMCGPTVRVTAAVHRSSCGHRGLYTEALRQIVANEEPNKAFEDLEPQMFSHMQRRFANRPRSKLPEKAARDLSAAASRILTIHDAEAREEAIVIESNKCLLYQQRRERIAFALSLRELCYKIIGPDCTPSVTEVEELFSECVDASNGEHD